MFVKCSCENCDNHIEFDDAYKGQLIKCPHCFEYTRLLLPKAPFISEQTSQIDTPLPEITVSPERDVRDNLTEIVIENRGNSPSCGLRGVQVEINYTEKTLTFSKIKVLGIEIKPISNIRKKRINYTSYKIADGIYLYRRAIKGNYRENDLNVFKLKEGELTLVWKNSYLWDCKGRMETYYSEYFGSYEFIYDGSDYWDDKVRPMYSK